MTMPLDDRDRRSFQCASGVRLLAAAVIARSRAAVGERVPLATSLHQQRCDSSRQKRVTLHAPSGAGEASGQAPHVQPRLMSHTAHPRPQS